MATVTERIKNITQPIGGYIKLSQFKEISYDDGIVLDENENIHPSIVGMTVDYLTRYIMGADKGEAFKISLFGAMCAEKYGKNQSITVAYDLLNGIYGIDDCSIINACKLVTFDVWYRNPSSAILAKDYSQTNPDITTIKNIHNLVKRSQNFFKNFGKIIKDGFSFEPIDKNKDAYNRMISTGKGNYGGYTATVSSGDGDFLTEDTLWDFKVSKSKPSSKNTLQLLMYWIMGQHSGQEIFKKITRIGIFNPRLNSVFFLNVESIPDSIIKEVEDDVICYN